MGKVLALVFLSVSLELILAQEVMFDPKEFRAAVGSIASSRCHLVPNTEANAEYQWFDVRGNQITSRNSNDNMWLRNPWGGQKGLIMMVRVQSDDNQGVYQCKAIVDGTEYTGNFRLNVYEPLTFSNCPDRQTGVKGEEGRLSCKAKAGSVSVGAIWERNGHLIQPSQRYRFEGINLIIYNVTEDDKGHYVYTAIPSTGSGLAIDSRNISFDVWTKPKITKPVMETTGVDGGNATLFCEAVGYPDVEFSWYKGISMIRDTGRIRIQRFKHQSQLQFRPVIKDDRGQYLCQARNGAGTANQSTTIIVQSPPRIQDIRNITRVEKNGATLWCNATGEPRPFIELLKVGSGQRITTGDQTQGWTVSSGNFEDKNNPGTWFKLDIRSVKYSDAGAYKCEALNNAGEDQAVLSLEVHFAPKMDQQPDGPFYNWKGNEDGHLPCVASANPLPVFRWLRNDGNTEITSADPFYSIVREEHRNDKVKYPQQEKEKFTVTSKLMITDNGQNPEVYGTYTCEVRNTINKTRQELTLTPAAAPGQPVYSFSRETPTLVNISFVAQGVAGPPVIKYRAVISRRGSAEEPRVIEVAAEWREWSDDLPGGEKRTIMTVKDLEPATDYSFTLYAVNAVGEGPPVERPYTTKSRSVPSSVPVLSEINSPYPGAIVVRWQEPENGGAQIMHYLVGYRQVNVRNNTDPTGGYVYADSVHPDFKDTQLKPDILQHTIQHLLSGKYYQVRVVAVNNIGKSLPLNKIVKTKEDPRYRPVGGAPRPAVSTIITLVAVLATACIKSFL